MHPFLRCLRVGLLALMACAGMARAQPAPDPHAVFEADCLSCHGHAGAFARAHLRLEDGRPLTSRGVPVASFLRTHRGGLPEADIAPMIEMFRQQLTSGALYERRCLICHDRARDFARLNLILHEDRLFGRYSGHEIAAFLHGHARLTQDEASRMRTLLERFLDAPE